MADLTWHIDIRQEVHFDLQDTVAAAGLASAALHIKAESSLLVAARLGILRCRKQVADLIEQTCVRCRIGTRCSSDRGLVDVDDLIELFHTDDVFVCTRNRPRTVQISCQPFVQNFIDKGTLSRSGDSGHAGHDTEREIHVDIFQIVLFCSDYLQPARRLSALGRNRNFQLSA